MKYTFGNLEFHISSDMNGVTLRSMSSGEPMSDSPMRFQDTRKALAWVFDVCFEDASSELEDMGLEDDDYEACWAMLKAARDEFRLVMKHNPMHTDISIDLESLKSAIAMR